MIRNSYNFEKKHLKFNIRHSLCLISFKNFPIHILSDNKDNKDTLPLRYLIEKKKRVN